METKKLIILFGGPESLLRHRVSQSLWRYELGGYDLLFVGNEQEENFLQNQMRSWRKDIPFKFVYSYNTWTNISDSKQVWATYDELFIASEKYHLKRIKMFFSLCGRTSGLELYKLPTQEKWNAPVLFWLYSLKSTRSIVLWLSKIIFNR